MLAVDDCLAIRRVLAWLPSSKVNNLVTCGGEHFFGCTDLFFRLVFPEPIVTSASCAAREIVPVFARFICTHFSPFWNLLLAFCVLRPARLHEMGSSHRYVQHEMGSSHRYVQRQCDTDSAPLE